MTTSVNKTVFQNTTPDLQDQDRLFRSQSGLVLRPMVSDHIIGLFADEQLQATVSTTQSRTINSK